MRPAVVGAPGPGGALRSGRASSRVTDRAAVTVRGAVPVERAAVAAALCRAVLVGRAAAAMTVAAGELLLAVSPGRVVLVIALLATTGAAQVALLTRWPGLVGHPLPVLAVDAALLLVVLAASGGSPAYFAYAAGCAALAGVLLGMTALPLWAAQLTQGYAVCGVLLRDTRPAPTVALFVLVTPLAGLLAGIGAVAAGRALEHQLRHSVALVARAQRSAAGAERARLARELHDSVVGTLRGISLAAWALPDSVRRQPGLAEQLAATVSQGAVAAARQARLLVEGLRLDTPDDEFGTALHRLCRDWSAATGIPVEVTAAAVEPPVAVRYELIRIVGEALANVARHARARVVRVDLAVDGADLRLTVRDDGAGFVVPDDLADLQERGHLGIVGMRERARGVGGDLLVRSAPGAGTLVRAGIPAAPGVGGTR